MAYLSKYLKVEVTMSFLQNRPLIHSYMPVIHLVLTVSNAGRTQMQDTLECLTDPNFGIRKIGKRVCVHLVFRKIRYSKLYSSFSAIFSSLFFLLYSFLLLFLFPSLSPFIRALSAFSAGPFQVRGLAQIAQAATL